MWFKSVQIQVALLRVFSVRFSWHVVETKGTGITQDVTKLLGGFLLSCGYQESVRYDDSVINKDHFH